MMVRKIVILLIGILIGCNIYLFNARRVGKNLLPMPFGYGQAVVKSGSMSPAFEVGDLLIYQAAETYEKGDMIAFRDRENDLVTHRIVGFGEDYVITKGDANPVEDEPVSFEDVYGKVILIVPKAGKVIVFLQSPASVVILLLLFFCGLEWNYYQAGKASKERLKKQREELAKLREELSEAKKL